MSVYLNLELTLFASGRTAGDIVTSEGLTQIDNESAILALVRGVLTKHADAVSQYRAGKTTGGARQPPSDFSLGKS